MQDYAIVARLRCSAPSVREGSVMTQNARKLLAAGIVAFPLVAVALRAQTVAQPSRSVTDPGVVTTRQTITPAGVQSVFEGRVHGVNFGATEGEVWVYVDTRGGPTVYSLDWRENRVDNRWQLQGKPALQGLAFDSARKAPVVAITVPQRAAKNRYGGAVQLLRHDGKAFVPLADDLGSYLAGAPAVARPSAGARAVVPLIYDNALAVINAESGAVAGSVKTDGVAPFGSVISGDGKTAWVSNWGGRWPKDGDPTLPTGLDPNADRVVVDNRGIASTGTVVRVDLDALKVTHTIDVGLHPTAMVWDETRRRLYVANANTDTISIIDTDQSRVVETMPIKPFGLELKGVAPSALAVSPSGDRLFVALGGFNAVAMVDTNKRTIIGFIPTAWYPNHLALSADGKQLAVATLLGVGSGWQEQPKRRYVHSYRGTVSVLPVPDDQQLASFSTAVAENNHVATARERLAPSTASKPAPLPVPARAGEPSLIEHVVYIIKENRTYDQLFGDLGRGNGEPSFVMFGADVTPNHRKLATDFVLLDNFYATGGNSGDGHQWVTQASETSYALWPGYEGRSYPFDGTDPIAYSNSGFLWDLAQAGGKSVRVYGEYAGRLPESDPGQRSRLLDRWQKGEDFSKDWNVTAPLTPLNRVLAKNYPAYSQTIPDVVRAQIFLKDVAQWTKDGAMPNLVLVQLPSDHTRGATPEQSTPKAHLADNDLALGQIVEGLTQSPFWSKMAIFVVEDDAQNGVDHVDGHRTVALAISPYIRRGAIDSTFYAQQSMVKTIELTLGLPTMSLFDLIATDMRASFTTTADARPYTAVQPKQSLFELNPKLSAMRGPLRDAARASMKMRFDVPDAAPTDRLNRINWGLVHGWQRPYPAVRKAVFAPFAVDLDDDEREQVEEKRPQAKGRFTR
jgi:DNA-binding beta-propeller fold protein YncE